MQERQRGGALRVVAAVDDPAAVQQEVGCAAEAFDDPPFAGQQVVVDFAKDPGLYTALNRADTDVVELARGSGFIVLHNR